MSRRQHRAAGLIAAVVAGGQLLTPASAWAADTTPSAVGVTAVGTVTSVRTADSTLVVTRAYLFRDSRPRTVRFNLTAGTAVVVNGATSTLGSVRTGMQVAVTGTGTNGTNVASRVVARK